MYWFLSNIVPDLISRVLSLADAAVSGVKLLPRSHGARSANVATLGSSKNKNHLLQVLTCDKIALVNTIQLVFSDQVV